MANTLQVAADKARDGVVIALKAETKLRTIAALTAARRATLELADHIDDELARLNVHWRDL